jgi:hypothetical protein
MTVWIYVDPSKEVGDVDHLKVFANLHAAEIWLEENDPEGVAFEYVVLEWSTARPMRAPRASPSRFQN